MCQNNCGREGNYSYCGNMIVRLNTTMVTKFQHISSCQVSKKLERLLSNLVFMVAKY